MFASASRKPRSICPPELLRQAYIIVKDLSEYPEINLTTWGSISLRWDKPAFAGYLEMEIFPEAVCVFGLDADGVKYEYAIKPDDYESMKKAATNFITGGTL
jgi:hypothetical protein